MKRLARSLAPQKPCIEALVAQDHLPQALKYSLSVLSLPLTDQIYSLFIKKGHSLDPFLSSILISHFAKLGKFHRSLSFLSDTQNPDIVTYNAFISGLARFNQWGLVFKLFNWLRLEGLRPDMFSLRSLVKACENFEHNKIAHTVCLKLGFSSGAFLASGLVENYTKCGDILSAKKCFRECLQVDNVVCTAMVSGYVWNGEFKKSKEVFIDMRGFGLELNEFSLTSVISASLCVEEGEQIHGFSVKLGLICGSYNHLNNAIMNMYARFGKKLDAIKVFDEIAEPDVVSWTERIRASFGCVDALTLFKVVFYNDFQMNEYIIINVLSAVASERMLKLGKQIQVFYYKLGFLEAVSVGNALISMYMKCGKIHDARLVFDDISCRD